MKITTLHRATLDGALHHGMAVSKRGVRYKWSAMPKGEPSQYCFREHAKTRLPDGKTFWLQVKLPTALHREVQAQLH
jgi:hypothetical protein